MSGKRAAQKRRRADVSHIQSITGADPTVAERLLDRHGSVEAAVQAFFEQDHTPAKVDNVVDGEWEDLGEFAADPEGIRAPDASQNVRFSDDSALPPAMHGSFLDAPVTINTLGSVSGAKQSKIQQLYRIPEEILFYGSYAEAREAAIQKRMWLLVNIQNMQEFDCQLINRDVWNNGDVRELVSSCFLFWQQLYDTPGGLRFLQLHKASKGDCPYVAIIDPVTGAKMWSHSGRLSKDTFTEAVYKFLSSHRLEVPEDKPHVTSTTPATTTSTPEENVSNGTIPPSKRRRKRDADEEALAEALKASTVSTESTQQQQPSSSTATVTPTAQPKKRGHQHVIVSIDSDDSEEGSGDEVNMSKPKHFKAEATPTSSTITARQQLTPSSISMPILPELPRTHVTTSVTDMHHKPSTADVSMTPTPTPFNPSEHPLQPEPSPGIGVCRVQFKFADGTKVIRRFHDTAQVSQLYSYIYSLQRGSSGAGSGNGSHDVSFELVLPHHTSHSLSTQLHDTLNHCGVANSVVIVRPVAS